MLTRFIQSLTLVSFLSLCAWAQEPVSSIPVAPMTTGATSGALQASNLLNPNVSVIGWFQAEAGRRQRGPGDAEESGNTFQMKEAELAIQSVVDSWGRADIFIAANEEEVELEEGYLTWYKLPANLGLKVGKIKANFGRFNRLHTPETFFADRPLVHQNYFGEEGLSGAGASLAWQVPVPWFLNLDLEALQAPEAEETPSFDRTEKKDLLGVGRLASYHDLTEAWNLTWGGSTAFGPGGVALDPVSGSSHTLTSQTYGADLTLRWKNPRRAVYRSLIWTTEALWNRREMDAADRMLSHGLFSHINYQFARRWHTGVRYDYSQFPTDGSIHEEGQLLYLTFDPSEFSRISLQGRHVKRADGADEHLGFLKISFNIGPHGAHPF